MSRITQWTNAQWTNAWYRVKRTERSKKSLPSLHRTGADGKGHMHTMCGIRVREATHVANTRYHAPNPCDHCDRYRDGVK
jgi:hypothetical protein